jgi:hypothetical protein
VATLAVLAQPLVRAGIGRRYPWELVGLADQARIAWGVIAIALLVAGWPVARSLVLSAARREAVRRVAIGMLLACPPITALYDWISAWQFARFGYASPLPLLLLDALVGLGLVLWLRSGRTPGTGVALSAVAAAAHRLAATALFPLDERRSDMFGVLLRAARVWSAGGKPYVDAGPQGLKYLPGTWLAQAPAVSLGLDPRIFGSLLLLGTGVALALSLRLGVRRAGAETGSLAELLTMLVFLSPYHAFRHDLYFDAFLALTVAIFHIAARASGRATTLVTVAVLTGLAAATRQWAWVYGPFALLAASLAGGRSGRRWLGAFGLAGLVGLATAAFVMGPLLLQDPAAFRKGVFSFSGVSFSEICLGVSALAAALGVSRLLPVAQGMICVGAFARCLRKAWRGTATPDTVLAAGWLAWGAVVLLNPFLENYFYVSLGFAAAGLACSPGSCSVRSARSLPKGAALRCGSRSE